MAANHMLCKLDTGCIIGMESSEIISKANISDVLLREQDGY